MRRCAAVPAVHPATIAGTGPPQMNPTVAAAAARMAINAHRRGSRSGVARGCGDCCVDKGRSFRCGLGPDGALVELGNHVSTRRLPDCLVT